MCLLQSNKWIWEDISKYSSYITTTRNIILGYALGFCVAYIFWAIADPQFSVWSGSSEVQDYNSRPSIRNGPVVDINSSIFGKNKLSPRNTITWNSHFLNTKVTILCWVMITEEYLEWAKAVHFTWGDRCTKIIYFGNVDDVQTCRLAQKNLKVKAEQFLSDKALPIVNLNTTEGSGNLWGKTKTILEYLYNNYKHGYNWFFKADDDTYTLVENLRLLLAEKKPESAFMLGYRLYNHDPNDYRKEPLSSYIYGGSSFTISKAALELFVTVGLPNPKLCRRGKIGNEDYELSLCLQHIGVQFIDTWDKNGHQRFIPMTPTDFIFPQQRLRALPPKGLLFNRSGEGDDCCSERAITFHRITPSLMFKLDFILYYLKVQR